MWSAVVSLERILEVAARLFQLRAQALEQVVGLDAGAHLVGVVEHHVREDRTREPHRPRGVGDALH